MPKPQEVVPLLEKLLDDPHVYVQKGVGWTFRELFNAYPALARKLLKKHIYRISGIAWQAATEKLPKNEKKALLQLRKNRAKKKL